MNNKCSPHLEIVQMQHGCGFKDKDKSLINNKPHNRIKTSNSTELSSSKSKADDWLAITVTC